MSDAKQIEEINKEQKLKEEQAKLDKYRDDLIAVQQQLEPKAELFNALKERGISSVDELSMALAKKPEPEKEAVIPEAPKTQAISPEIERLEKTIKEQGEMIQQQNTQMKVTRLMSDIKAEMGDKPEYQLLRKALNENIAYNILRSQAHDEEKGLKKELSHYLGVAEKDLRGFYTKLGGTIEEGKKPEGEEKSVVSSPESLKKPIDFPSLPASGGSDAPNEDVSKTILKLGENKQTGKFDQEVAFDKFIDNKISSE